MKAIGSILILIAGFQIFSSNAWSLSPNLAGLVGINHKNLYVEYSPATAGKPTVVLVNGLTYSTRNWAPVARSLIAAGYGVVSYDMAGMGASLLSNPIPVKPILFNDQVEDLRTLLRKLKIKAPYHLVGLSYGGGIIAAFTTRYPKETGHIILLNPYTEFLETQKSWIKQQIENTRTLFPQNQATDEELTDYFIRELVYTTYPLAEPSSLENPYKLEGITRMVQGIRMYQPVEEANSLPRRSLHLVISEQDQYIPQEVYSRYWEAVPEKSHASLTYVKYSEHKLPEAFPRFTFQFIKGVLDKQPLLFNGDVLIANPLTMEIRKK